MIDFCRRQTATKQGQIRITLLFSVLFICAAVIGMTVFAQPYAVYATGERVADPWVVNVDGIPVVVVDSEEAGEAVETGLRMHYAGSNFEDQQEIEMLTPDSSRFWPLEGYEPGKSQPSYDKQFVRDWLKANPDSDYLLPQDVIDKTIEKYKEAYHLLSGKTID